mmetsp:Transcript_30648/g.70754  ORF Transcript_30648/g.70754 Transcript_30648/m.70754 type:complete len:613 (-) Transcript_30648:131-1969(-)
MTSTGSSLYRLVHSRQTVEPSQFSTLLKQEKLTFEEVDFSQCQLTSKLVKVVIEICKRCPKLKILKLYKNLLDDEGAVSLAEMLGQKPNMEEVHLSHNQFTAAGIRCLVEACEKVRGEKSSPLWLRLEQNHVADAEKLLEELEKDYSVCRRADEVRCTVRVCVLKKKVHLPHFTLQREPVKFVSRAEREAQAAAAKRPPAPARTLSMRSEGTPKAAPAPCAWGAAGARSAVPAVQPKAAPSPCAWGAPGGKPGAPAAGPPQSLKEAPNEVPKEAPNEAPQSGYPSLEAKAEQSITPKVMELNESKMDTVKPSWKAGSRPSIVLDHFGQRRTMPEQLTKEAESFICTLCEFVMVKPLMTRCSHLFCENCFKEWVSKQVELHKMEKKTAATPVPQIRCPHPKCQQLLKKTDVQLLKADDMLQRLRNNLQIRCVHHVEHHACDFGKDAERIAREQGITCDYSGAPDAYEEHMLCCPVEAFLKSEEAGADDTTISTDVPTYESARSQCEAEPEPEEFVTAVEGTAQQEPAPVAVNTADGEVVRVAGHTYVPAEGPEGESQIRIEKGDHVKVFKVMENGWAAGVRICKETGVDDGDVGWFPEGYLLPPGKELSEEDM